MFCFSFFYKTSPAANWYIHEEKEFVFNLTLLLTENCELPHKHNFEIMQKYLNWFFSPQLLDALKCRQLPAVVTIFSWSFAGAFELAIFWGFPTTRSTTMLYNSEQVSKNCPPVAVGVSTNPKRGILSNPVVTGREDSCH